MLWLSPIIYFFMLLVVSQHDVFGKSSSLDLDFRLLKLRKRIRL